jgi:hypothetical protein
MGRHRHSRIESSDGEEELGGVPEAGNVNKPSPQNLQNPKQGTETGAHQPSPNKASSQQNKQPANDADDNRPNKSAPKETKEDLPIDEPSSNDDGPLRTSDIEYPDNRDDEESIPEKEKPPAIEMIVSRINLH